MNPGVSHGGTGLHDLAPPPDAPMRVGEPVVVVVSRRSLRFAAITNGICVMNPRSQSEQVLGAGLSARRRRHRRDTWLAVTAMLSALLALPLAQHAWHGPGVVAILVIAAIAQFAGHPWAIAMIVLCELLLLPTVWPRAFLDGDLSSRLSALITLVAMVPGLLAMRHAAAALAVLIGKRHSRRMR